jgi:hypothetical protein
MPRADLDLHLQFVMRRSMINQGCVGLCKIRIVRIRLEATCVGGEHMPNSAHTCRGSVVAATAERERDSSSQQLPPELHRRAQGRPRRERELWDFSAPTPSHFLHSLLDETKQATQLPLADQIRQVHPISARFLSPLEPQPPHLHPKPISSHSRAPQPWES